MSTVQDAAVPATASPFDALNDPSPELVEAMRRRFPVEPEADELLVRKMRRRASGPYVPVTLEQLSDGVRSLLAEEVEGAFEVSDERWFTGGASKIQMGFALTWEDPVRGRTTERMMVRMDPSESLNATSKLREHQLLKALDGVLPVPRAHWVDPEARHFPEPALVYSVVDGVTKPQNASTGQVSGLGTNFGPALRGPLGEQFVAQLARLHTLDAGGLDLGVMGVPRAHTTQSAAWQLNHARRVWEEDRGEDLPLMEVAADWLERNLPTLDRVSIVHGDYRSGNFLFDEGSATITAWLDWELAHLGDRHLDLTWACHPMFGHHAEDGGPYLISGLMPEAEFFARYEDASGLAVDPERVRWYRILNSYTLLTKVAASAYRVVRLGKTHQDILLARVEGVIPGTCRELRTLLQEVL